MRLNFRLITGLFLFGFNSNWGRAQDTIQTNIILDSLENEVYYLTSKEQEPIGYYSPIFTPVCVDGTCYPIKINLFWDLAGNYHKYTLDTNEILTKIEHLPFTEFDYGLLHRVIANSQSALANYTIYELTDTTQSTQNMDGKKKVDGITGATRPELQGAFVPDALYTSYTLWHLVRKPKQLIEVFTTQQILTSSLFNWVLNTPQAGGQQLALQYLLEDKSPFDIVYTLSPIIDSTDNQLTIECIRLIPPSEMKISYTRELLSKTYKSSKNATVKKAILERWQKDIALTPIELEIIASELGNYASLFQLEQELLMENTDWTDAIYYSLQDKINETSNMMRREKIKQLLYRQENHFPKKFKRHLKRS